MIPPSFTPFGELPLTQLALCARKTDFIEELGEVGVSVAAEPTLIELIGGFSDAVDAHVHRKGAYVASLLSGR